MILRIPCKYQIKEMEITPISAHKLRVTFPYDQELVDEVRSWEGAKWQGRDGGPREWHIDNSPRNKYCMEILEKQMDPRYHDPIPDSKETFREILMSHQKDMVIEALHRKRVIWAAEPGTGKTLAAIEVMEHTPGLFWIIVPRTARFVWEFELRKWQTKRKEFNGVERNIGYKIIPMHMIRETIAAAPAEYFPNHLIVDEIHFFKNASAKRTEALLQLSQLLREANPDCVQIGMTGTPAPKDPTDWWTLAEFCQPGFLRESAKNKLKYRLGVFEDQGDYKKLLRWRKDEVEKLYRRLKGMVVIKLAKDCLDLPPLIYTEQQFEVTAKVKLLAAHIKESCSRAITSLIRLRQFSDGFQPCNKCKVCEGDGNIPTNTGFPKLCPICEGSGLTGGNKIETPKDEALIEYLSEDRDRIVIYAGFHQSIDKITAICREAGWQVIQVDGRGSFVDPSIGINNTQEAFSNGKGKIAYVGQPSAGGVSITLNKSEIIIFYSNDFNGASRMQAEKRIHRIGTNKATIIDFLWLPSDRLVLDNLKTKQNLQAVTMGDLNEFWEKY